MRGTLNRLWLMTVGLCMAMPHCSPSTTSARGTRPTVTTDFSAQRERLNVVVISMDAVRYDRTGLASTAHRWTPNLNRLAERSVVFHQAYSSASWTVPSHLAIWTGRRPSRHGVVNKLRMDAQTQTMVDATLSPEIPTYPSMLLQSQSGMLGVAFTGGAGVSGRFGYNRRFQTYIDDRRFAGFDYSMPLAVDWLRAHQREHFFMFLHGYDAHGQHPLVNTPPRNAVPSYRGALDGSIEEQGRYREQMLSVIRQPGDPASLHGVLNNDDADFMRTIYDRKIEEADSRVGVFLHTLEELGLMDRTLIVVLSDHGEEFMEHQAIDHGHTLFEEQLHVPLLFHFPGMSSRIDIRTPVRTVDVFPTVFHSLGLPQLDGVDGQSLLPLIRQGENALSLPIFAETDYRLYVHHRAVRSGQYKLILDLADGERQLFDLQSDPQELRNRANDLPQVVYSLETQLSGWMQQLNTDQQRFRGRREAPITVY